MTANENGSSPAPLGGRGYNSRNHDARTLMHVLYLARRASWGKPAFQSPCPAQSAAALRKQSPAGFAGHALSLPAVMSLRACLAKRTFTAALSKSLRSMCEWMLVLIFLQFPPALRTEAWEVIFAPATLRGHVAARRLARRRARRTVATHALIRRAIAVFRVAALFCAGGTSLVSRAYAENGQERYADESRKDRFHGALLCCARLVRVPASPPLATQG